GRARRSPWSPIRPWPPSTRSPARPAPASSLGSASNEIARRGTSAEKEPISMDAVHRIRRFVLSAADRLSWLPPTLTRVAVGVVFVGTGWGKLHTLDKITGFFAELRIPAPGFNAVLASSAELVCGALILVGLLTRLASLPLIVVMAVAILTAKRGEIGGLSDLLGFVETLYIAL